MSSNSVEVKKEMANIIIRKTKPSTNSPSSLAGNGAASPSTPGPLVFSETAQAATSTTTESDLQKIKGIIKEAEKYLNVKNYDKAYNTFENITKKFRGQKNYGSIGYAHYKMALIRLSQGNENDYKTNMEAASPYRSEVYVEYQVNVPSVPTNNNVQGAAFLQSNLSKPRLGNN